MKTSTRAVIIGGGVVGVSTLYHLARKGWSDVMLFERNETEFRLYLARRRFAAAV